MDNRNYKVDNIRFLLIFFVVFGHLLELFSGQHTDILYRMIYTFHMPAFIFVTGYFARFNPKKILLSLIYPYFLFQTFYLLFQGYMIDGADTITPVYTTPYWLLWYLLVTIFYYILIPLIQWESTGVKAVILSASIIISLLAGQDNTMGYYMSLSRFFCFLPFFIAGFFSGHDPLILRERVVKKTKGLIFLFCLIFLIIAECFILSDAEAFSRKVLYGSYSYTRAEFTWEQRAVLHATAFAWIGVLFIGIPGKKLPIISTIGKNTLPVFLFHGFVIRFLRQIPVFQYSQTGNLCLATAIALAILLLFGNPCVAWLCKWGFTGHWINALVNQRKRRIVSKHQN